MLEQEIISHTLDSIQLWKPGAAAITDLGRFRQCVAGGVEGKQAEQLFDNFSNDFSQDPSLAQKKYEGPSKLPPTRAIGYLRNAKRELDTLSSGKTQSYECSSFAYSAISELMLNDDIRKQYDILQVGTMRINQGKMGLNYAHNIAVLVPKGSKVLKNGPLPEGALIIDPWARSLGHPVNETLAVSPDKFIFHDCLYPLIVNYNSANEKNLEETVSEFREDNPSLEQERAIAQQLIQRTEAPPITVDETKPAIIESVPPVAAVQEQTSNWGFLYNAFTSIASISAIAAITAAVAVTAVLNNSEPGLLSTLAATAAYASMEVASDFNDYKEKYRDIVDEGKNEQDAQNKDDNRLDMTPPAP
ncbi:MAG: hypothetical protein M1486_06890 [Gammaproteobacteria bacterium]|nr:hypothetical protein [Gammaproteobacteria bacterium]